MPWRRVPGHRSLPSGSQPPRRLDRKPQLTPMVAGDLAPYVNSAAAAFTLATALAVTLAFTLVIAIVVVVALAIALMVAIVTLVVTAVLVATIHLEQLVAHQLTHDDSLRCLSIEVSDSDRTFRAIPGIRVPFARPAALRATGGRSHRGECRSLYENGCRRSAPPPS